MNVLSTVARALRWIAGQLSRDRDNDALFASLRDSLAGSETSLRAAVAAAGDKPHATMEFSHMANPVLDSLAAQVTATNGVVASAVVLINGFADRITAAVQAAIAGGATAADLAPVTDEVTAMKAATDALAAAVAASTPPPSA